jgi:hypothetical protein
MQTLIEVKNSYEAEVIARALAEPDLRAFILVAGALRSLSPRGRRRVLDYVADLVDENKMLRRALDEEPATVPLEDLHAETPHAD